MLSIRLIHEMQVCQKLRASSKIAYAGFALICNVYTPFQEVDRP